MHTMSYIYTLAVSSIFDFCDDVLTNDLVID